MEPKTIIVFSSIFLIFVLSWAIPAIRRGNYLRETDEVLENILGEEFSVTY